MALRDPVVVYYAASNQEAHLAREALMAAEVEAFVIESSPLGGAAKVWVERAELELAKPVLADFERRAAELREPSAGGEALRPSINVVCEECGGETLFASTQGGSVQNCPHCGAHLDVYGEVHPASGDEGENS
jgi:hypothetical protein